jgi:hypothetical protein
MVAGSINSNSVGGSANSILSIVRCRHFHENISLQEHFGAGILLYLTMVIAIKL